MRFTHSRFIDLREFALRGGQRAERFIETDIEPIVFGGEPYHVFPKNSGIRLAVDRITGGYLVTLFTSVSIYGSCFRCLREVALNVDAKEQEFVSVSGEGASEGDTSPYVHGFVVDVAGMAREAVIMALPAKLLCDEGCRGLCPQCGKNLNEGECDCEEPPADPRWQKLEDLRLEQG